MERPSGVRQSYMIVACIVAIGLVCQAQIAQKDETSPLYDFRAAQVIEELGLAPSGSANSVLEFGSVATADLTVQTVVQTKQRPRGEPILPSAACSINTPTAIHCQPLPPATSSGPFCTPTSLSSAHTLNEVQPTSS